MKLFIKGFAHHAHSERASQRHKQGVMGKVEYIKYVSNIEFLFTDEEKFIRLQ